MISLIIFFTCILLLICFSSVLSSCETAFVASSHAAIQAMVKNGNKRALKLQGLLSKLEKVVATILLGNNMINIVAASLASQLFTELFGEVGLAYASAFMTVLIVVYAEIVPKFLAINNPERIALMFTPLIHFLTKVMYPLITAFEWMAKKSLALVGVTVSKEARFAGSIDELRGAIDLHHPKVPSGDARAMLHSILDLNEVTVEEVMVHRQKVTLIDGSLSVKDVWELIVDSPYTRLPIYEKEPDNIVGILHVKSFLRGIQKNLDKLDHLHLLDLAQKPWFIPDTTTLGEQLLAFRQRKEHFAVVVDEYGAVMGIVTLEDIVEEIVGDIDDELDAPLSGVWVMKNGDVFASGSTTIRDLNRQFSWDLPDEEASTIAGLLLHESRSIPETGQCFRVGSFAIKVMRRMRHQISLVQIRLHKNDETRPLSKR